MTAIAFTSRKMETLADGSLRFWIDVPADTAREAMAQFGVPGSHGVMLRNEDPAITGMLEDALMGESNITFWDSLSEFLSCDLVTKFIGTPGGHREWIMGQPSALSEKTPCQAVRCKWGNLVPLTRTEAELVKEHGWTSLGPDTNDEWAAQLGEDYTRAYHCFALSKQLGYESPHQCPPAAVLTWAKEHKLIDLLPERLRGIAHGTN